MVPSSFFALATTVLLAVGLATAEPPADPQLLVKRDQCANSLNIALAVAHRLQDHYFNWSTGQLTGGSLWTDANTLEDLHNLMLATNTNDFDTVADASWLGKAANNANTNWNSFLGGSNDDAGWIVLALWKMGDYKQRRGQSTSNFWGSASKIYDIIEREWDTTRCGGGVWWSTAHTYKNAITNELFLLISAQGYRRGFGQKYLDNAKKTWDWLKNSGMRNGDNLWNDGLTDDCKNNGQTTWTYNQGVIASGLAELAAATGDKSLLTEAEKTLDATIARKIDNRILRESCDDAVRGGAQCNQDQQIFKGLWMKHLQFYLDAANDPARIEKYKGFIGSQASGVYHFGTNSNNDIGSVWYAPDQGGSVWTPKTSASGLEAHICAAKYGPCPF